MTLAITGDRAQLEVASTQRRNARTEMVIADRFANVELIDLNAVNFVPLLGCPLG